MSLLPDDDDDKKRKKGIEQGGGNLSAENPQKKGDAPPVFMMPDGLSYLHVKRNGLIFGCATARNVSPTTVIEVRFRTFELTVHSIFEFFILGFER